MLALHRTIKELVTRKEALRYPSKLQRRTLFRSRPFFCTPVENTGEPYNKQFMEKIHEPVLLCANTFDFRDSIPRLSYDTEHALRQLSKELQL